MNDGKTSFEVSEYDYNRISVQLGNNIVGTIQLDGKMENNKGVTRTLNLRAILSLFMSEESTNPEETKLIESQLMAPSEQMIKYEHALTRMVMEQSDCPICARIFVLGTVDEPPTQEEIDYMQKQLDELFKDPNVFLITHPNFKHLGCK
jgi:hypothetical protein